MGASPQAEQRPVERTLHGVRLIDEYAWLKAENWREVMRDPFQLDPAIRAYLQAENDYCERALADTKGSGTRASAIRRTQCRLWL